MNENILNSKKEFMDYDMISWSKDKTNDLVQGNLVPKIQIGLL